MITSPYAAELAAARDRTIRFALPCPGIPPVCGKLLTEHKQANFAQAVFEAVGELELQDLVAQCLAIHWKLKPALEVFFDCPILFTIGYVSMNEQDIYKQTESELFNLLQTGIKGAQVSLHAWLTLPSLEIIDLSLSTSLAVLHQEKKGLGGVIAAHADELLNGLRYRPMLLGDEYLKRIGALIAFPLF